ncbi:hypothetical protein ACLMJK_002648 [Lecanora helva]
MASLKAIYQSYLANPSANSLSDNAALNYISTLTTINTAAAIIKHHAAHSKVLKKKEEKVLSCVESDNAVCLDIETTLEFLMGGGAYLPSVEDNFLADRVVTFPMVHIVHFDSNQKIKQIRLYWDQGSLLKQVEVIGARAKSWPIRDGKDQARLIATSAAGTAQSNSSSRPSTASSATETSRDSNDSVMTNKPRSQSKNVTRDPHASLSLFAPREEEEEEESSQPVGQRAPKAQSAKPPPRDYHDLFVGDDSEASLNADRPRTASPTKDPRAPKAQSAKPPPRDYHDLFVGNESDASPQSKSKIASPQKENVTPGPVLAKTGAGKNFKPSRLFDTEEPQPGTPGSPEKSSDKFKKPHPKKYNHFEFGENTEIPQPTPNRPKSKHQNNWNFEDFETPDKVPQKIRSSDVRHFGWGEDDVIHDSPAKHPQVAKARPDASANFEFRDDGTPGGERRAPGYPRGMGNVKGTGLYTNNVFDEDTPPSPEKKSHPLATVTNLKDRRKDFDPHFTITDESPDSPHQSKQAAPIPEARAKVVNQMNAQWESKDYSPTVASHSRARDNEDRVLGGGGGDKENQQNGSKTGGNGMGGKKGLTPQWGFGDDEDGQEPQKFRASKAQQAPKERTGLWDF